MVKINYVVKTDNYHCPAKKGITEENLIQFLSLFLKKSSKFSKWLKKNGNNKNMKKILKINVNKCLEKPIHKMKKLGKMIDDLLYTDKLNGNLDNVLQSLKMVEMTGGRKKIIKNKIPRAPPPTPIDGIPYSKKDNNSQNIKSIIAKLATNYLFNPDLLVDDFDKLMKDNTKLIGLNKNDPKAHERLVYKIEMEEGRSTYNFFIKLSPNINQYLYESEIYKIVSGLSEKDNKIKCVKYHGHGIIKYQRNLTSKFIITIKKYDGIHDKKLDLAEVNDMFISEMDYYLFARKIRPAGVIYMVTEDNRDLTSLKNLMRSTINPVKLNKVINSGISLIRHINKKHNFIHWDWHSGNVLVNSKGVVYLFDFDFSEINIGPPGMTRKYGLPLRVEGSPILRNVGFKFSKIQIQAKKAWEVTLTIDEIGADYDIYRFLIESGLVKHINEKMSRKHFGVSIKILKQILKKSVMLGNMFQNEAQRDNSPINEQDEINYFDKMIFQSVVVSYYTYYYSKKR